MTNDSDDGELEEPHERVEDIKRAADTVHETAEDTLGEGTVDSLFDGVDDATDDTDANAVTGVAADPTALLPSRKRLLGFVGGRSRCSSA